jgi:membrane protease YdiL (CAAX protease family)
MAYAGSIMRVGSFLCIGIMPSIMPVVSPWLASLRVLPWPWLDLFLGRDGAGHASVLVGILHCDIAAAAALTIALLGTVWSAGVGLAGSADDRLSTATRRRSLARLADLPLVRKELLWLWRDRSAILHVFLVPLATAGFTVFNLRSYVHLGEPWSMLSAVVLACGNSFISVLGPQSLGSEGSALWLTLTWPQGLERMLAIKARMWTVIGSLLVVLALAVIAFHQRPHALGILAIAIAWLAFAKSSADKSVTLVRVGPDATAPVKPFSLPRVATNLGVGSFIFGIGSQHWHIACSGLIYSWLVARAMTEDFHARLPYLFDGWSAPALRAPTVLQAMVATALVVDVGSLTAILIATAVPSGLADGTYAAVYAACAGLVCIGMLRFLARRAVPPRRIWIWPADDLVARRPDPASSAPAVGGAADRPPWSLARALATAVLLGIGLALAAKGYLLATAWLAGQPADLSGHLWARPASPAAWSTAAIAVLIAPPAEELLFRGLLYRALDRLEGGLVASLGSALVFTMYHPVASWLPVFLLGWCAALLFRASGWLAAAVLLHLVYNLVLCVWP